MNKLHSLKWVLIICSLLALTACGGGSSSSNESDDNNEEEPAQTAQGVFIDSAVEGLSYVSGESNGLTDENGTFTYEIGATITFSIGDIVIGSATGSASMTPLSLVSDAVDEEDPQVVNIARLLQTLDDDGNPDNGITITEVVRDQADTLTVNFSQSLDEFTYDGSVQIIVSSLTGVTTAGARSLISAEDALEHLQTTLGTLPDIGTPDDVYCADNTPTASGAQGNIYSFEVSSGNCLGIAEDNSPRKTVPLSVSLIDVDDDIITDTEFSIESSVRIYLRTNGLNFSGYDFNVAVDVTNNSNTYYCYDMSDIVFTDANGAVLIDNAGEVSGWGGALYQTSSNTRHRCLPPGTTFTYVANSFSVSEETFNNIEAASIESIELDLLSSGYVLAETMTTSSMDWISPGLGSLSYPTLSVSFTNTTNGQIELDDNTSRVWFFDDDGYAVSTAAVYLEDGLGIDEDDLTDEDYIIDIGESFTLNDTYADNAAVTPSSATSARVYLEWTPVNN